MWHFLILIALKSELAPALSFWKGGMAKAVVVCSEMMIPNLPFAQSHLKTWSFISFQVSAFLLEKKGIMDCIFCFLYIPEPSVLKRDSSKHV